MAQFRGFSTKLAESAPARIASEGPESGLNPSLHRDWKTNPFGALSDPSNEHVVVVELVEFKC